MAEYQSLPFGTGVPVQSKVIELQLPVKGAQPYHLIFKVAIPYQTLRTNTMPRAEVYTSCLFRKQLCSLYTRH